MQQAVKVVGKGLKCAKMSDKVSSKYAKPPNYIPRKISHYTHPIRAFNIPLYTVQILH